MPDWFVALADRSWTLRSEDPLALIGCRSYRPRYRERVVVRGAKSWRDQFLLGQYVLVELRMKVSSLGQVVRDWADQFHAVLNTSGVSGVLNADGAPLIAREVEIERLRASEHRGYVPPPQRGFRRGQRVTIERGAMADVRASYQFSCDKFDYVTVDGLIARVVKIPLGSLSAA